jgi:hypothetical protein
LYHPFSYANIWPRVCHNNMMSTMQVNVPIILLYCIQANDPWNNGKDISDHCFNTTGMYGSRSS